MKLHQPRSQADWLYIEPAQRNIWQRIAATTYGLVTPANGVSLLGGALVAAGLFDAYHGHVLRGSLLIIVGRLADIADGFLADRTGTKSSIGEAVDATLDKLAILGVLIIFSATEIIPLLPALLILLQNGANVILSALARSRKKPLHATSAGKLSTAAIWAAICLYGLAAALEISVLTWTVHLIAGVALAIGFYATSGYAKAYVSSMRR